MAHGGEGCSIFLLCQTALASIWEAGGLVGHLVAEALCCLRPFDALLIAACGSENRPHVCLTLSKSELSLDKTSERTHTSAVHTIHSIPSL
jgi:hypothetical protein